jgi:MFS family permease
MIDADRRVLALAAARAADAFSNSFLIVVLPLYIENGPVGGSLFGLAGAAAIGVVLGVVGFTHSALQPLVGRTSDALGRRRVFVLAGLGLLAVANLAYAWTGSLGGVLGVRLLQGVALALAIPTTIALVSEVSAIGNRGESMGLYNTLRLVGYAIGPVLAGAVVHGGPYPLPAAGATISGFAAAFGLAAAAALAGFAVVAAVVQDPDELETQAGQRGAGRVLDEGADGLDPVFALAVATFFVAIGLSLIGSIENEINARLDQSPVAFGLQFSAFLVPHVLLQIPIGRWSDRHGRRPFVLAGLAFFVPATLVQGFVTEPWQLVAARFGQGLAAAVFFAPGLALAGDLAEDAGTGASMGLVTSGFGLGVASGPIVSGFLVAWGFAVPFAVGAACAGLAWGLVATQVSETVTADGSASESAEAS